MDQISQMVIAILITILLMVIVGYFNTYDWNDKFGFNTRGQKIGSQIPNKLKEIWDNDVTNKLWDWPTTNQGVTFLSFKFGNNKKLPNFLRYAYLSFKFKTPYPSTFRIFIQGYPDKDHTTEYMNYAEYSNGKPNKIPPQLYYFPLYDIWNKTIRIALMKQRVTYYKETQNGELYCELSNIQISLPPYVDFENKKFNLKSLHNLPLVKNFTNNKPAKLYNKTKYTSQIQKWTKDTPPFSDDEKIWPDKDKIYFSGIALLKASPGSSGEAADDLPDPDIETGDIIYYIYNANKILTNIIYKEPVRNRLFICIIRARTAI